MVFVNSASGYGGSGFRWSPAQPCRLSKFTANAFRYSPSRGKIVHKNQFPKYFQIYKTALPHFYRD